MSTVRFLLLASLGLALYFVAYQCVQRPLTDGEIVRLVAQKKALLQGVPGRRLVIVAGSNGRYSHSCAVIGPIVGRPCVNASLIAGIGADYLFANIAPLLHEGDVVYMPFEYQEYTESRFSSFGGPDNEILWHRDKPLLASLGIERTVRAAFYADEQYFIRGTLEMVLSARGVKPRVGQESMNKLGDQIGHSRAVGAPYQSFLRTVRPPIPPLRLDHDLPYSATVVSDFIAQAHARGIAVIGGLPTLIKTPGGADVPPATVQQLRAFYESRGQRFLALPNESRYGADCFFDKPYHLNEECQLAHSEAIGRQLQTLIDQGVAP